MKTILLTIAFAAMALTSCQTATTANTSISTLGNIDLSWVKFCEARHYDVSSTDSEIINEYLDTWCGSVDEEQALNN